MTDTTPPNAPDDDLPQRSPPAGRREGRVIGGSPVASKASAKAPKQPGNIPSSSGSSKSASLSMADMLIGSVLADRYKLLNRIGEGAMGWVFIAEHIEIGKRVAIKVLRPSLCRLPEAVRRFRREARSATSIGSKHIVDVTDFGTTDTGSVFLVMENLEGEDLSSWLKREKFLPWRRVVHIVEQLCEALQAAHDAGIIHRDVKPANFFRVDNHKDPDFIKILDFGIARLANPQDSIVTQTGVVMGTPDFMAPEQAMGKHVDHRADVYSLGASAYALLTGRPPFEGANEYDVIYKQLNDDPTPPSEVAPVAAELPKWLDDVILKALRKDADDRYGTMAEFGETLREAKRRALGETGPTEIAADGSQTGASLSSTTGTSPVTAGSSVIAQRGGVPPSTWVWAGVALIVAAGLGYALLG